jgi:EAL domain-containing protein (putative c-di-GMP-specific phosphodiesterase class I)
MEKNEYARVVKTIIDLGSILGLKIIAEGVENNDQLQELIDYHCHFFQGYLFKRPVPKDELQEILVSGNGVVAANE